MGNGSLKSDCATSCYNAIEIEPDTLMYCVKEKGHQGPCRPVTVEEYCSALYRYWEKVKAGKIP